MTSEWSFHRGKPEECPTIVGKRWIPAASQEKSRGPDRRGQRRAGRGGETELLKPVLRCPALVTQRRVLSYRDGDTKEEGWTEAGPEEMTQVCTDGG